MAMRWRCPPETVPPRSPTMVSYPSGSSMMKLWACAARAACSISSSVASKRPKRIFSRIVPANNTASWCRMDTLERSFSRFSVGSARPSRVTVPEVGSMARTSRDTSVDLPAPDGPTMAMFSPGSTSRLKLRSTGWPSYAVLTSMNRTSPKTLCRRAGRRGLTMSDWMSMRSATRSPDALARAMRPVYLAMSRRGFMVVRR